MLSYNCFFFISKDFLIPLILISWLIFAFVRKYNTSYFEFNNTTVTLHRNNPIVIDYKNLIRIERDVGTMSKTGAAIYFKYKFYYKDEYENIITAVLQVSSVDLRKWNKLKEKIIEVNPSVKIWVGW